MNSFLDLLKTKIISKLSNHHKFNSCLNCDSFILQLYHKTGVIISFLIYTSIIFNLFFDTPIVCINSYDASKKPEGYVVNYCLSYPKILDKYALFYKWVPWTMLILCFLFFSPKILINNLSCRYTSIHLLQASKLNNNHFKHNTNNSKKKDENDDDDKKAFRYKPEDFEKFVSTKWDKCKRMYFNCLFCHCYSLFLNVIIFITLDFCLQQRFLFYVPKVWPMTRNVENFSDFMSREFYPFSVCLLPPKRLTNERTETLYCHLTLMEYYEKIFVFIWFYLVLLFIINIAYIIYLGFLVRNNYNSFLIHIIKKSVDYNIYLRIKRNGKKHLV